MSDDLKLSQSLADVFHNSVTAWIVLAVSLLLTLLAWMISNANVESRRLDRFNFEVDTATHAIVKRMEEYEQVLRGGVALFRASDSVTRNDWKNYVSTLLIDTYWPGIQGIGYAVMLQPDERAKHEETIRAQGYPHYTISPGGERAQYSAIVYLEPFSGRNLRAFGYDMYSNPIRREAMQRAADTGQPALSGKVTLVQETNKDIQAGFLVYLPLYQQELPLTTLQERRAALTGFVYSPFRVKDLLNGILGKGIPLIDYQVFDGEKALPDQLLYDSREQNPVNVSESDDYKLEQSRSLRLQGRNWTVNFTTRPGFREQLDSHQPTIIAIAGLLVDVLLFAVIISLARHRRNIDIHARHLGKVLDDLKHSEKRLKRTHQVAQIGSWQYELASNQLTWADETYSIFGLSRGAPVNLERFRGMIQEADRNKFDDAWHSAKNGLPLNIELRIGAESGERWINLRAEIIFDDLHVAQRILGSVQDISERKRSERELQLAKQVFQHASEGIIITDPNTHIIDVNPMFSQITGFDRSEVIGRNPRLLASDRHDRTVYRDMWVQLKETGCWKGELWNRHKSGRDYLELLNISVIKDADTGEVQNYIGIFTDVTEAHEQKQRLEHLAHHDSLTGLVNRHLLMDRLEHAIALSKRQASVVALAFIDLDGFKPVNDTYGHQIGDLTLIEVSKRLKQNLREGDTVARLGGDEFAILFAEQLALDEITGFINRLVDLLARPYHFDDLEVSISSSIGLALYPVHADTADKLVQAADQAMYQAKESGRNQSCILGTSEYSLPAGVQ